jgi:hypothetical protein
MIIFPERREVRGDEGICDFSMAPCVEMKIFKGKIRVGRFEMGSTGSG